MNQIPKLPTNFQILSEINDGVNPTFWVQNEQNQQFILKVLPSKVEAQNEFKVLQFLQENTGNIGKSLKTNFENKKTILTPKPILTIRNNLIFEPIGGIMLDDNLDLTNGLEKEKTFEILKKALRLLKQVHQIPTNKINKLKNLQKWSHKTTKIVEKIEILKAQNPAIIKKIKIGQNWTKLSQSLKSNLLDDLQNEQSLCHGDFSLSHIYYQNRLRNQQNDKNNSISKIKNNDLKNLQFSGIIDFGDASLASPYLDIAHFILKEINKSFGTDLGEFVLRTYFENEKIDYDLLTYFGSYYTIIRLFEFRENEKLFAKFGEKYEFFLDFIKEMKTKQIL